MPYTIDVIAPGRKKYVKEIAGIQNIIEHPNVIDSRRSFTKRTADDALVLDAMVRVREGTNRNHPVYLYPVDAGTIKILFKGLHKSAWSPLCPWTRESGSKKFTADDIFYNTTEFHGYALWSSPVRYAYKYISNYIEACDRANDIATNIPSSFIIGLKDATPGKRR